jgi:hypothetical protein
MTIGFSAVITVSEEDSTPEDSLVDNVCWTRSMINHAKPRTKIEKREKYVCGGQQ